MKAIGKRVLVKQTMERAVSKIHLLDKDKKSEEEMFGEVSSIVEQIGKECPKGELAVGDNVIFGEHFKPSTGKCLQNYEKDGKQIIVNLIIAYYEDIVGVDNDEEI